MNEIALTSNNIPATFDDLNKFVIVAQEQLKAVRLQIEAIKRVGLAQSVLEQKIKEAQEISEIKTRAEIKLGELTAAMPKAQGTRTDLTTSSPTMTKFETLTNANISKQKASQYELMAKNPEIVEKALSEARNDGDIVSRAGIINMIKAENRKTDIQKQVEQIQNLQQPDGLFDVIVIDPAWNYGTEYSSTGRRVANPYPEMSFEELKHLNLPASNNCVLFLWTTHKFIWNVKELLDSWDFEYRNMLVWDKKLMGMGNLFRMRCEFCLVGIKGKPIFQDIHNIEDIIEEPRREHSRKPDSFYNIVDKLCTGRKLDYFSRQSRNGWTSFGNDTR